MTNKDYTALVFLVDRSGSMTSIARDMEGGISALLEEQQKEPGKLTVDYTRFDDYSQDVYTFADPAKVKIKIEPRNTTALYDAIARKINTFGAALAALPEEERPGTVLFAIVTDGMENASREYDRAGVQEMIKRQTDEYGWKFTYLGANQDAMKVGTGLGIAADASLTYNPKNVHAMTQTFNSYATVTRSGLAASYSDEDRLRNA